MADLVKIGMADMNTVEFPGGLTTLGLGSCVGVCLYDPAVKIAGMLHVMLPYSTQIKNNSNIAKFADTGIVALIDDMLKLGAKKSRILAKIAGGSQMFATSYNNDVMKIGLRNVQATKEILMQLNIPLIAEDTGGNHGRTIELYSENGALLVKTIGYGVKTL